MFALKHNGKIILRLADDNSIRTVEACTQFEAFLRGIEPGDIEIERVTVQDVTNAHAISV